VLIAGKLWQMSDIRRRVKQMNIDDTSEIDDVLPQQGPPGARVSFYLPPDSQKFKNSSSSVGGRRGSRVVDGW